MTGVLVFVVADQHVVESRAHPMPWWNVLVYPGDHLVAGRRRVLVVKRKRRQLAGCLGRVVHSLDLGDRSEEHTSELQSQSNLVCRLLLEKKKNSKKHRDRD